MKKIFASYLLLLLTLTVQAQDTYVLVHGAWGGGWAWKEVDQLLSKEEHTVYRPTLTGLGEKVHLANKDINLTTHITDVVNLVLFEDLQDIVLMGHSYGGLVITGVAEKIPERIKRIIYVDAFLPLDGESAMGDVEEARANGFLNNEKDGFLVPPWVKEDQALPHDVPHPLGTFTEKISLKDPQRLEIPGKYILTVDKGAEKGKDGFYASYIRAKEMNYDMHIMTADHNAQWSKPKELVELMLGD